MCSDHCWHSPVYTYLNADNHKSQQLLTRTIEDCTRSVLCKRPMLMLTRVFVQVPGYCFSRFVKVPWWYCVHYKTKDTHAQCADNCWHRPEWTVTRVIAANSVTPTFPPRLLFPRTPSLCPECGAGGRELCYEEQWGSDIPSMGEGGGLQGGWRLAASSLLINILAWESQTARQLYFLPPPIFLSSKSIY